jgi:ribose transport system substrate-binding protein
MKKFVCFMFAIALMLSAGTVSSVAAAKPKIAFIVKTMNHPFYADMTDGAKARCEALGYDVYFDGPDREIESDKQMQMVENAIIQKVDAICLTATDSQALADSVKKANDANIPVITLDAKIDAPALVANGGHVVTFIGSDNYQGGVIAGQYIANIFKDATSDVEIGIIEGIPGHETAINRKAGFEEGIKGNSHLKIVASQTGSWERELGMNVAQNMLQANPNIKCFFGSNDNMALGAVEAARAANKLQDIKIIGFDGIEDALTAIKTGDMVGTVGQYPYKMGEMAIDVVKELLNDPNAKIAPINYTEISVIDVSNIDRYTDSL